MATTITARLHTPMDTANNNERDLIHPETDTDSVMVVSGANGSDMTQPLTNWMDNMEDRTTVLTSENVNARTSGLLSSADKLQYDDILNEKTVISANDPALSNRGIHWYHVLSEES